MKTIETRSLLTGINKEIEIPIDIENTFNNWLGRIKKVKNKNQEINLVEIFYAGYILSNPVVRDQYKEAEKLGI